MMFLFGFILFIFLVSENFGCDLNENCVQMATDCKSQRCKTGYTCKMTIADCYVAPCTAYAFCIKDNKTIDCESTKECPMNTVIEEAQCLPNTTCDPICRAVTPNETITCDDICCSQGNVCLSKKANPCQVAPCESPVYCAPIIVTTSAVQTTKPNCETTQCEKGHQCEMKPCLRIDPPCDPEPVCVRTRRTTTVEPTTPQQACFNKPTNAKECTNTCTNVCNGLF